MELLGEDANMAEKARKTDRRTLYTQRAIKDALLDILHEKRFDKVTVSDVCRRAEITRDTFYLHYKNLAEVLDEILEEAMADDDPALSGQEAYLWLEHLPTCQRVSSNPKYLPFFKDPSITNYLVERLFQNEVPLRVPEVMQQTGLDELRACLLMRFAVYGSFAVNAELGWKKDALWRSMQDVLTIYTTAGMRAVGEQLGGVQAS